MESISVISDLKFVEIPEFHIRLLHIS